MKLDVMACALACGLIWGRGFFCLTWRVFAFDGSTGEVTIIGRVYRGYAITPIVSVRGVVWGFFDGLIGGAVFAWLYNRLVTRLGLWACIVDLHGYVSHERQILVRLHSTDVSGHER